MRRREEEKKVFCYFLAIKRQDEGMKISAALWFTLAMFSPISLLYNSSYGFCFMFFMI